MLAEPVARAYSVSVALREQERSRDAMDCAFLSWPSRLRPRCLQLLGFVCLLQPKTATALPVALHCLDEAKLRCTQL